MCGCKRQSICNPSHLIDCGTTALQPFHRTTIYFLQLRLIALSFLEGEIKKIYFFNLKSHKLRNVWTSDLAITTCFYELACSLLKVVLHLGAIYYEPITGRLCTSIKLQGFISQNESIFIWLSLQEVRYKISYIILWVVNRIVELKLLLCSSKRLQGQRYNTTHS